MERRGVSDLERVGKSLEINCPPLISHQSERNWWILGEKSGMAHCAQRELSIQPRKGVFALQVVGEEA